jgi:hypothetical protein
VNLVPRIAWLKGVWSYDHRLGFASMANFPMTSLGGCFSHKIGDSEVATQNIDFKWFW